MVSLESHGQMENISEKKLKKKKKNEDENFQLFIQNSYNLQNLITKTIVLSANENIFWGKFLNIKLNTH